jgi:hypothetical protein
MKNVEAWNMEACGIDAHKHGKPFSLLRNDGMHALHPLLGQGPPPSIPPYLRARLIAIPNITWLIP